MKGGAVRQLQVVGISDDGRLLLLATSSDGRPSHSIELDRRLERAVRGLALDEGAAQPSALSPKEIQSKLRSGASIEQVARDAGVPIGKVERYAGPVLSEREQVVSAARASTMTRPRGSSSVLPLGASIEANLRSLAYARPETAEWVAYRRDEGEWIVRFEVTIRGRRRRAEWAHHPATHEVVALNSYALSLGFVETTRPPKLVVADVAAPKPAKAPVKARAVGKTHAAVKAKPAVKPVPKQATVAKKVVVGKEVVLIQVPVKAAVKKAAAKKATAAKPTATKKAPPAKTRSTKAAPAQAAPVRKAGSARKAPAPTRARASARPRSGTNPVVRKP